jgi:hypothetical protein
VALGRKNWLFMGSERGGQAAAICMTLAATCKRAGVNPLDYFQDVFGRIMAHSTHKLDELLPGNWQSRSAWKPMKVSSSEPICSSSAGREEAKTLPVR